ncbi:hypothetical protein HU749_007150 [Pseudomonas ogarae]|uniref:hypothetical protein n=1 Tax=Pseudomonas ogarae (strain DSM 112162 / CECT 30235 / F113) TaxID=1114970 RepID=UPI00164646CC|nr:hypothetical protein [Pseudomonas zarinae]QXH96155.1 hypothetical protein HU749_007150 [Pseudomonas zarinae]
MEMLAFFQRPGRPVSILRAADPVADMFEMAKKVVPAGIPYWVVSLDYAEKHSSLHEVDRDEWVVDAEYMGRAPDGLGSLAL